MQVYFNDAFNHAYYMTIGYAYSQDPLLKKQEGILKKIEELAKSQSFKELADCLQELCGPSGEAEINIYEKKHQIHLFFQTKPERDLLAYQLINKFTSYKLPPTALGTSFAHWQIEEKEGFFSLKLSTNQSIAFLGMDPNFTDIYKIGQNTLDKTKELMVNLSKVLRTYHSHFMPRANQSNLQEYCLSEDYQRHAKTARLYYNSSQLTGEDALRIIYQREPTNIAMTPNQYNREELKKLFGYEQGIYNDKEAKKADQSSFSALPNTVAVYSETYLWDPAGGTNKKEIACFSLPAPALDSALQPHYKYYMSEGKLDEKKYQQEMEFLFRTIEKAARDHKDCAFGNKGLKRLVLSRFGQGAFLGILSQEDRKVANNTFRKEMEVFLDRIKEMGLQVVMSEYSHPNEVWYDKMIIGDILATSQEGDLIINAWDPNSAPGNGNDSDISFDGAMGKGSAILLTQTAWLNATLRSPNSLIAI